MEHFIFIGIIIGIAYWIGSRKEKKIEDELENIGENQEKKIDFYNVKFKKSKSKLKNMVFHFLASIILMVGSLFLSISSSGNKFEAIGMILFLIFGLYFLVSCIMLLVTVSSYADLKQKLKEVENEDSTRTD